MLERAVRRSCPAWLAQDWEEVVQTALLRLFEYARKRGEAGFTKAYVFRAGQNAVIDECRRRIVRNDHLEAESADFAASSAPDPERRAALSELGNSLRECLAKLIASRREVLTLCLLGWKNREISEHLSLGTKKVENLLYRARRDLEACLAERGVA